MPDPLNKAPKPDQDSQLLAWFATPLRFYAVMGIYFGLHVLIRSLLNGAANLDESEQFLLTQNLALGYGPQPPLYTWMQAGVFAIFGTSVFGAALLKNALLLSSYYLAYLNGRLVSGRHSVAVIGALSLLFIPQFAWESQRDLTHSVLASTLALATLFTFLKASSTHRWFWYVLLGICIGGGVLAKYNYVLWAVGLLGAGLWVTRFRPGVLSWKTLVAVVVAILIVSPHVFWALEHRNLAMASSSKLALEKAGNWFVIRGAGFGNMVFAAGAFILPLLAIYGAFFWARRMQGWKVHLPQEAILVYRALLIIGMCLICAIVAFGATGFKDRWFQPLLIAFPVVSAAWFSFTVDNRALRWIQTLALVVMAIVAILIPAKVLTASATGREERLNLPYAQLSERIKPLVQLDTVLVADTQLLAGNLRRFFPENVVEIVGRNEPAGGEWIMVWDAGKLPQAPAVSRSWTEHHMQRAGYLDLPWTRQPEKRLRVGIIHSAW